VGKGDLDLGDVTPPVKRNGRHRKVGEIERELDPRVPKKRKCGHTWNILGRNCAFKIRPVSFPKC
jgi:hypothetical protein